MLPRASIVTSSRADRARAWYGDLSTPLGERSESRGLLAFLFRLAVELLISFRTLLVITTALAIMTGASWWLCLIGYAFADLLAFGEDIESPLQHKRSRKILFTGVLAIYICLAPLHAFLRM